MYICPQQNVHKHWKELKVERDNILIFSVSDPATKAKEAA